MKRTRFSTGLTGEDRVEVSFEVERGRVVSFVVNYVAKIQDKDHSVVRFDTAHGFPHKDVCRPDGSVERKERLQDLDYGRLLDTARRDILENWPDYRRRFERWLK